MGSQPQGMPSMVPGSFSHLSYLAAKTPATSIDMAGVLYKCYSKFYD